MSVLATPFFLLTSLRAPAPRMGAPGYWHARRDALVRELTRRELELEELEVRLDTKERLPAADRHCHQPTPLPRRIFRRIITAAAAAAATAATTLQPAARRRRRCHLSRC